MPARAASPSASRRKPYGSTQDQPDLPFEIGEIEKAIYAKLVQKVGNRHHWEDWANDIAKIARTHIDRITAIARRTRQHDASAPRSTRFAKELRDDLNDSISDAEIIEMLAQHLITKPVFDALFEDYSFASTTPCRKAMQGVLDVLQEHHLDKEADTLQALLRQREDARPGHRQRGRQAEDRRRAVRQVLPQRLPEDDRAARHRLHAGGGGGLHHPQRRRTCCRTEFGQTLGSKGVHIIDPFTGTGTFITRLLQSGLITPEELPHKYKHEIHANEIVLLAYYIAAINIEAVYHGLVGGNYQPFEGICLTDTFQMYEKDDLVDALLVDNSARRKRQKKLDIRVIIGNPPYSVGQEAQNDNNQNVAYPHLDSRIATTYAARSDAALSRGALYDSYIRAIRWASDRIGDSGVIGFVTNAGFLDARTPSTGFASALADEFSSIYVFHLRGNQTHCGRTVPKGRRQDFRQRQPRTDCYLALRQESIGRKTWADHLPRHRRLSEPRGEARQDRVDFGSIAGITAVDGWLAITPDDHGDWLKQRDDSFRSTSRSATRKDDGPKLFENFSLGVVTNRDAWCYNASKASVACEHDVA